jgi:predicted RNA-binding Zn-ribbon protein involved in translation (DUF1610 family)
MKQVVPILAILVIIVCAGYMFTSYGPGAPKAGEAEPSMQPLACNACGKAYAIKTNKMPSKCHYCGKMEAWRAAKCLECKAIFPQVGFGTQNKLGGEKFKCTKCGKARYGEVSGAEIEIIK